MDLFNKSANESEKEFLKNRMRAIFGSTEMLVHGIIKSVLALLFIFGGFSLHVSVVGAIFMGVSSVYTFVMYSKMLGERKYSPVGAKIYSVLTLVESIWVKIHLLAYCVFIMTAMFGFSLFGKYSEEVAVIPYKMGLWCFGVVIVVLVILAALSGYFKYQRRFAENIFDCVDAQLVFFSTERKYSMRCFVFALVVFIYNVFKMLCPSWYRMNVIPAKLAEYLDSGILIEKYGVLTFFALILLSAHFILSGRLASKYIIAIKKLNKKVNERRVN